MPAPRTAAPSTSAYRRRSPPRAGPRSRAGTLLGVVAVPVVDGRHAGLDVVEDLRHDQPRHAGADHQAGGGPPEVMPAELDTRAWLSREYNPIVKRRSRPVTRYRATNEHRVGVTPGSQQPDDLVRTAAKRRTLQMVVQVPSFDVDKWHAPVQERPGVFSGFAAGPDS